MTALDLPSPAEMMTQIRQRMEKNAPSIGAVDGLADRVAVVGSFDLGWLHAQSGGEDPEARSAVLALCEPLDSGLDRWRMRPNDRVGRLQEIMTQPGAMHRIVAQTTPLADDAVGKALQGLLLGDQPDLAATGELIPLFDAATLVKGIEGSFPEPSSIRREMSRRALTRQLANASARFVGRDAEVAHLTHFLTRPAPQVPGAPIPILSIHGIGGIGKSALLARCLAPRRNGDEAAASPITPGVIFSLDFDRIGLDPTQHAELGFELTRQIALLHPAVEDEMDRIRRHAKAPYIEQRNHEAHRSGNGFNTADANTNTETSTYSREDLLMQLRWPLSQSGLAQAPAVLLFDTLERLQKRSDSAVVSVMEWISSLRLKAGLEDIRVVVSGRAPLAFAHPAFAPVELLPIEELDPAAARSLVEDMGVDPATAAAVVNGVGGNPLVLRLAARFVLKQRQSGNEVTWGNDTTGPAMDRELVQGMLYDRILGHIDDPAVKALAHPGLVVRRVTPEVLADVIHPVVGTGDPLAPAEAVRIYEALAREAWLVEPAPDGIGVIHRADVRRMTMTLLGRSADLPETIERIHRAAIRHYEEGRGKNLGHAAAEALYHRFMIADCSALPPLDRMSPQTVQTAIGPNREELPERCETALAGLLGEALPPEAVATLPDQLWPAAATRLAANMLESGRLRELLEFDRQTSARPGHAAALDAPVLQALDLGVEWETHLARLQQSAPPEPATEAWIARRGDLILSALRTGARDLARGASEDTAIGLVAARTYPISPSLLRLAQYRIRAAADGSPPATFMQQSVTTGDLLKDTALADAHVRLLQVMDRNDVRFRPTQNLFLPSADWLRALAETGDSGVEDRLLALAATCERDATGSAGMTSLLGNASLGFEQLWTDAFVRGQIGPAAASMLMNVRTYPEFRGPLRTALAEGLGTTDIRALVDWFRNALAAPPPDLEGPLLERGLAERQHFITTLVAFADRSQRLEPFIAAARAIADTPALAAISGGLDRWLRPHERRATTFSVDDPKHAER